MLHSGGHGNGGPNERIPRQEQNATSRSQYNELSIPKNRSASNLASNKSQPVDISRTRYSFDAGIMDGESIPRSPILPEHEHGLGASGLRRIRQQPTSRPPTLPSSLESSVSTIAPPRSSSMTLSIPSSRVPSGTTSTGLVSPGLNLGEDLSRFPSESLHSFSFTHQSEDYIYSRQNLLKRSIDFMRDKMGWAAYNPAIATAQAKISGDQEIQSMMELLARANVMGQESAEAHGFGSLHGPLTGPAEIDGGNIFEKTLIPRSESPEAMESLGHPLLQPPAELDRRGLGINISVQQPSPSDRASVLGPVPEDKPLKGEEPSSSTVMGPPPPISPRRMSLKRTYTDVGGLSLQTKLMDALAKPYVAGGTSHEEQLLSPATVTPGTHSTLSQLLSTHVQGSAVHGHTSRWAPASQAIFTTEANAPWTILAANDLACLVFGVTKAEVRKMGILEVVQEERRRWLEEKLKAPGSATEPRPRHPYTQQASPTMTNTMKMGNGVTAKLLNKPPSRQTGTRRAQTDDGSGSSRTSKKVKGGLNHSSNKSRGVLLCGDVVPIQKRNGATGSASLWVKEKKGGLIWVLEEISEDVVHLKVDEEGRVTDFTGVTEAIWVEPIKPGTDIGRLVPHLPRQGNGKGSLNMEVISHIRNFTARSLSNIYIPANVEPAIGEWDLRVSSFPHIAGIMVCSAANHTITGSNSVFSNALFGRDADGLSMSELIPDFDKILQILTEEDNIRLVDGMVVPEHSFRRARSLLALREGKPEAAVAFFRPAGIPAKHRDGSEIQVDLQMRVVRSDSFVEDTDETVIEEVDEDTDRKESRRPSVSVSEVVYALWITYSRHLHATYHGHAGHAPVSPLLSRAQSPVLQPSPGQPENATPPEMDSDGSGSEPSFVSQISQQIHEAASQPITSHLVEKHPPSPEPAISGRKKTVDDFIILEDMGQGAYGQVKLARYKKNGSKKVVLKYVTKRRILVDTWTRDRRLGTVPLEIHVLDYLRRDGLKHPNIVEMSDFFEDDINYYIEMVPHGLPGMDLFDYIELRVSMDEAECRSIFVQVANALHHLHTKALVVHRDIKDENIVLDGEGKIKLIDFGSAAYIKHGPFDVFVGTIDYAAPEVLAGKPYNGKEQDVWALGILLYTIVYKENPFYSIDEIMDHDLRTPYIMSEESIDLIRLMLNRDVKERIDITQVLNHPWCQVEG